MSAMGQGGGDAAAQQQNGNGDAGQQQGGDLSALQEAIAQQGQSQQEMLEFLRSNPWQAAEAQQQGQQQQEPQAPELDLSWLDTGDPTMDQQIAQRLAQTVQDHLGQQQQQWQQQLEERFGQYDEKFSERERLDQARDLVEEFPEMAEQETANQVVTFASQLAQANGHPELANEPWFWRITYMAGRAADAHQQEGQGSGDPGAAHLEGGGGANPGAAGGADAGDQWLQRMNSDGLGHRALPFH